MAELLKLLVRALFGAIRGRLSRTNEHRILAPNPKRERYPARGSETSRVMGNNGETVYLATRIPLQSRCRYSVLFPGVLSAYEEQYFHGQSWARIFSDDRSVPESEASSGFFLCWSDEAYGTQDLFAHTWRIATALPAGLQEIHSDGSYLRAVIRADRKEGSSIDLRAIRDRLSELATTISSLPVEPRRRRTINDRLKYKDFILNALVIGSWLFLFILLLPKAHYIVPTSAMWLILISSAVTLVIMSYLSRGAGIWASFRVGAMRTLIVITLAVAAYQRICFSLRSHGEWTEWSIRSVHTRYQRYTRTVSGYDVKLLSSNGENDSIIVKSGADKACPLEAGRPVKMQTFTDLLGFRFADSVLYLCQIPGGSELPIELLD